MKITESEFEKIIIKEVRKLEELDKLQAELKTLCEKLSTIDGGILFENKWPDKVKKGRFTEYCKKQGHDGACTECAKKAMDSDDASVRGMASFYMNTVKPGGKDASDAKEEE